MRESCWVSARLPHVPHNADQDKLRQERAASQKLYKRYKHAISGIEMLATIFYAAADMSGTGRIALMAIGVDGMMSAAALLWFWSVDSIIRTLLTLRSQLLPF